MTRKQRITLLIIAIVVIVFSAGCGVKNTPKPTIVPAQTTMSATIVLPTPTVAPQVGKVIWINPVTPAEMYQTLKTRVTNLAAEGGFAFEERDAFNPAEIAPDWKIVVLAEHNDQLLAVLDAHRQIQFLVISSVPLNPAANLNILQLQPERLNFVAGMVSALSAPDWRTMGLFTPDEPAGGLAAGAFSAGAKYFCGICNSYLAPMTRFPVVLRQAKSSDPAGWGELEAAIQQKIIYMAYLSEVVATPELINHLASKKMLLAGDFPPPGAEVSGLWVATIGYDLEKSMAAIWPRLVDGSGNQSVIAGVKLTNVNTALLSPARVRLIDEALADMDKDLLLPQLVRGQ